MVSPKEKCWEEHTAFTGFAPGNVAMLSGQLAGRCCIDRKGRIGDRRAGHSRGTESSVQEGGGCGRDSVLAGWLVAAS